MAHFFQDPPVLRNQYDDDHVLRRYLTRRLPRDMLAEIEPDLHRFGQRVVTDVLAMGEDAHAHEPELVQFDPWGRRIDRIDTARGWHELERVSAEEGLIAIGYERKYRSPVADISIREALPVQSFVGDLFLSSGHDRRRGAADRSHARRRAARGRLSTPDLARSGSILDQRAVDDRTNGRIRCGPHRDCGPSGIGPLVSFVRHQMVHVGDHRPNDDDAGAHRGCGWQIDRRQPWAEPVLSRDAHARRAN